MHQHLQVRIGFFLPVKITIILNEHMYLTKRRVLRMSPEAKEKKTAEDWNERE
jgi:hypothetical protein